MLTIDSSYDVRDESIASTVADVEQLSDYYYCSSMRRFSDWNEHDDESVGRDWSAVCVMSRSTTLALMLHHRASTGIWTIIE